MEESIKRKISPFLIIGLIILFSMVIIILSYELQKNKNTYQSKASTSVCTSGINSVSSNVTTEILGQDQLFECRVEASSNSYPDIICGYFVGENNWPKNCPFSRWSGNTAIFLCDPNQPIDDAIPLPQGGDRLVIAAMRAEALVNGNKCKNQWTNTQNYVTGSGFYYIRKSTISPSASATTSPPQATSTTSPTLPTSTPVPVVIPPTVTPIVGNCGTAPVPTAADNRYKWVPLCSGLTCRSNGDCPAGANNQPGWCYGFDSGWKCLIYQGANSKSSLYVDPVPGAMSVVATATETCSSNISNPPVSSALRNCPITGGNRCSGNPKNDGNPCWWQWSCSAAVANGAASTATFTAANDPSCRSTKDFTVNVLPTLTPTPTPSVTNRPTPTSTLTPTPTLSGNVVLKIKLRFQGINTKPNNLVMPVKVTLAGVSLANFLVKTVDFTSDNNGIFSADVPFDLTVSSSNRYRVLIKGPKHLQRKICTAFPQESTPGTYSCDVDNITLSTGVNNFDFTGIFQLVGDLPTQDGVLNSFDLSLIRNNLGKTDSGALRVADLNLDGVVNAQDFSLALTALSIKKDEN